MTYVKWIIGILVASFMLTFLHYTLPQRDIVRVVGTEIKRMDISENSWFWASADSGTDTANWRDVRFIYVVFPDNDTLVYRNEDTGWGWPPYFKFDSSDVSAKSEQLAQDKDAWVAISHYGWRIKIFTIFPNILSITPVSSPDAFLIPWFNIIFFIILGIILFFIIRTILRFKAKRIDPVLEDIDEMVDDVSDTAAAARDEVQATGNGLIGAVTGWFAKWFGSAKK